MSTSPGSSGTPTSDSSILPPSTGFGSAGPGRRGHAHRRSAAISSMDLTALSKAFPASPVGGSAPCTPAGARQDHGFQDDISQPMSRSATSLYHPSPPASPAKPPSDPVAGAQAPIVVIQGATPRPLSIVSTDTSSSLSTVRPGHSRANSAAPSSKVDASPSPPKVRPKTADASLFLSPSGDHLSPGDLQLPRAASGPDAAGPRRFSSPEIPQTKGDKKKKKKKRRLGDDFGSRGSWGNLPREDDTGDSSGGDVWESASSTHSRSGAENKASEKPHKSNKKQKKVRSWAGAIFPLKSKRPHAKKPLSRRSPTPPPILTRTNSDLGSIDVNFDDDENIVVIRTPTNPNAPKPPQQSLDTALDPKFEKSWKPRSFYEQNLENDVFSPVIDLDAALGPFNTPEMSSDRVAGSAFSIATKRMYSGGRRGEFVGPEMRYHRRAESAPEMQPFDRSALGFNRFGGSSTMVHADVFYEEEEDAFLAESQSPNPADQSVWSDSDGIGESAQPSSCDTLETVIHATASEDEPTSGGLGIQVMATKEWASDAAEAQDGPADLVIHDDPVEAGPGANVASPFESKKSVEIVESDDWPSRAPNPPSPDVSPRSMSFAKRPYSSPVDFGYPQLTLPGHRASSSSAFPSPAPSNISFDAPRSATASSMTDHTSFHHFQDQPRSSTEDVPSLTSSASTRTNHRPRLSSFYVRSSGERSASFSTSNPPRSSHSNSAKRSSLVSLSRLVGGSHGEKSKLSYEEKPPADETEKTKKKGNRISRLMHFWKVKEKQKSKESGD
jgi:hypothetical protein